MGFTRHELEAHVGTEVDDLVGDAVDLAFVGINPGLWTAATGAHFARPGNRFYPALYRAGITSWRIDASDGYREEDVRHLLERRVAITNIVSRASARADELSTEDLRRGARALVERLSRWAPRVVAVVGLTAYRVAFGDRRALAGEQPTGIGAARLWVLGNPSGLNAHETVDSLARSYRPPAVVAGIPLDEPRWE